MGEKRSPEWYEAEHRKMNFDIFNRGIHLKRAEFLSDLIAGNNPTSILEIAAGGSILAQQVLQKLPDVKYCFNDFSLIARDHAKERMKFKNVSFIGFDIDKFYEAVIWEDYDLIICVSLEHLEHDKEILQEIPKGKKVFLSISNIDAPDHIRVLKTNEEIMERYGSILNIRKITDCTKIFKIVEAWTI